MDNQQKYNEERDRRWGMAKKGEYPAIEAVCRRMSEALQTDCVSTRYDEIWFARYDPAAEENAWVRGAPDYGITVGQGRYLYSEIKIKANKFRKTLYGGVTRYGSRIARYGCESYYLDRVPVYKNMCAFSERTGLDPRSFLLFFVSEDREDIRVCSLAEITDLIQNGYHQAPISEIQEGYGTDTGEGTAPSYLIPEDATHPIDGAHRDFFLANASESWIVPRRYYACNGWYYHCDRNCKYIAGKRDEALACFDSEALAAAGGRKRCICCFSQ